MYRQAELLLKLFESDCKNLLKCCLSHRGNIKTKVALSEKNEVTARKEYPRYSKISDTIKSKSTSLNTISGDSSASAAWQASLLE